MQLGAVEMTVRASPDAALAASVRAREALATVIVETKRILTLLRDGHPTTGSTDSRPSRACRLLRRSRLDVTWTISTSISTSTVRGRHDLPSDQEALTNSARHGSGGTTLRLERDGFMPSVTVTNRTAAGAVHRPGFGLTGMAERLDAVNGTLETRT